MYVRDKKYNVEEFYFIENLQDKVKFKTFYFSSQHIHIVGVWCIVSLCPNTT